MRALRFSTTVIALLMVTFSAFSQKAYLADPENFDPEAEIKIMVDINKCDCQRLLGSDQVYIWTWLPAELPAADPNANGAWTASNAALAMTSEGGDIWSFTMTPTEFYQVDAGTVYTKDFHFLVKGLDGSGEGGGGCDEDKTEDLSITVDPPVTPAAVIAGFPSVAQSDDVFTVLYDNNEEKKEDMQELNGEDLFLYAGVMADSMEYAIAPFFFLQDYPELKMEYRGDGFYGLTFIPEVFFADVIPAGATIQSMDFRVRRAVYGGPGDQSDAGLDFVVGCPEP